MNQKYIVYFLLIPLVAFASWAAYLTLLTREGTEVRLPIQGYDPRNLLSGHYIDYQIDWAGADCTQFENAACPQGDFVDAHRVYVPERNAAELDRMLTQPNYFFEVVYAYQKGYKPIVKKLLINGAEWQNAVSKL